MGNNSLTKEDILLEEYKLLNKLITEESHFFWTRFNILFVINSFLLSVCAFLITQYYEAEIYSVKIIFYVIIWFSCVIGLVITLIWFIITERGRTFKRLWADLSRSIEEELKVPTSTESILKTHTSSFSILTKGKEDEIPDVYQNKARVIIASLRWGQKRSINNWVSVMIFFFFMFWLALIPILIEMQVNNWCISGPIFTICIIPVILYLIDMCNARKNEKEEIKNQDNAAAQSQKQSVIQP
ncbi:MAG: RipA family octameric membrane protein [Candidatus Heimdallarchaeaceae archaeon]